MTEWVSITTAAQYRATPRDRAEAQAWEQAIVHDGFLPKPPTGALGWRFEPNLDEPYRSIFDGRGAFVPVYPAPPNPLQMFRQPRNRAERRQRPKGPHDPR